MVLIEKLRFQLICLQSSLDVLVPAALDDAETSSERSFYKAECPIAAEDARAAIRALARLIDELEARLASEATPAELDTVEMPANELRKREA